MTPKQYREALEVLGFSQRSFAKGAGIDERTSRRYALGEDKVPTMVAKLLELLELLIEWRDALDERSSVSLDEISVAERERVREATARIDTMLKEFRS